MNTHPEMVAPSSRVEARRDRAFFCIVGTLLAMAVVVYQGDYSGYKAALAERSAVADKPSSLIPPHTQVRPYRDVTISTAPLCVCHVFARLTYAGACGVCACVTRRVSVRARLAAVRVA